MDQGDAADERVHLSNRRAFSLELVDQYCNRQAKCPISRYRCSLKALERKPYYRCTIAIVASSIIGA